MYPTRTLSKEVLNTLKEYTERIVRSLEIKGLVNIQYVFDGDNVYVIEVNPRASRTVPILSKVTGIPMVKLAVEIILGNRLKDLGYGTGINEENKLCAVKIPVFSNEKLVDVDTYLGPEMKSTGEVLGVGDNFEDAIYKGFCAANYEIPKSGNIYVSLKDIDKEEGLQVVKKYIELGFNVIASEGTGKFLQDNGIKCNIKSLSEITDNMVEDKIAFIIDSPTKGNNIDTLGFKLRRKAAEHRIPVFTCIDTANIFVTAVNYEISGKEVEYSPMNKYFLQ